MCKCVPGCERVGCTDCSTSSETMGGMRGASSLGEVGVSRSSSHYASTPHLFVYHPVEEDDEDTPAPSSSASSASSSSGSNKEPIYSSAIEIRKQANKNEVISKNLIL